VTPFIESDCEVTVKYPSAVVSAVAKKDFKSTSQDMLRQVVEAMGPVCNSVVFLGGVVIPFLLTEEWSHYVRYAKDVDFIVDFDNKADLFQFEDTLFERGFKKISTGAVSQWLLGRIKVEALPADPEVFTFNNQWCAEAMQYAQWIDIGEGLRVKAISAPYYLGTKLNAFDRRGFGRFSTSKDIFDILLIFAGHEAIVAEIADQTTAVFRDFFCEKLSKIRDGSDNFSMVAARGFESEAVLKSVLPMAVSRMNQAIALTTPRKAKTTHE